MKNLCKIALRNLRRYTRRSLLTVSLIGFGVMLVLVFVAVTGSFKQLVIKQITESYLGDVQIHRRGYVAAVDNLPVNLNLTPTEVAAIDAAFAGDADVQASSRRLKFGGLFSNFAETTNIRMNGVYPEQEFATCPQVVTRIMQGSRDTTALDRGKILVP